MQSTSVFTIALFGLCLNQSFSYAGGIERISIEVLNTQESERDSVYFRFFADDASIPIDLSALNLPGSNRSCPVEVGFGESFQVDQLVLEKLHFVRRLRIEVWERDLGPAEQNEDEVLGSVLADVDEEEGTMLEGKRWSEDWTYDLSWRSSL